jgi:ABC-type branched-subunit amino acid transport system substrate-binding protein
MAKYAVQIKATLVKTVVVEDAEDSETAEDVAQYLFDVKKAEYETIHYNQEVLSIKEI